MSLSEKKLINELLQDSEICEFIDEHKINNEVFETYLNVFLEFYLKRKKCIECLKKGSDKRSCEQSREYLMPALAKEGRYLFIDYLPCKKSEDNYLENISLYSTTLDSERKLIISEERKLVLDVIKKFLKNYETESKGIYLHGSYGVGKTFIMQDLAIKLAKKEKKVAIIYYPDFVRRIKALVIKDSGSIEDIIEQLKTVDYLFIDDLGGESNTTYIRDDVLLPILQYRMVHHKPLFITSNLSEKEVIEHFAVTSRDDDHIKAVRIFERLKTLCNFIELKGENKRN